MIDGTGDPDVLRAGSGGPLMSTIFAVDGGRLPAAPVLRGPCAGPLAGRALPDGGVPLPPPRATDDAVPDGAVDGRLGAVTAGAGWDPVVVGGSVGSGAGGAVVTGDTPLGVTGGETGSTVVGADGAVVVVLGPGSVARTAAGGKGGWPFVPPTSVPPKVQASTLPGWGSKLMTPCWL
jgi:hypothetical protein